MFIAIASKINSDIESLLNALEIAPKLTIWLTLVFLNVAIMGRKIILLFHYYNPDGRPGQNS